jgi:tetratricopeptide (TPR) repeat protein
MQLTIDNWDFDVRNCTLFHRDANGYYEFAHKSLAEFFVAFKFAAEMGCLAVKFEQTYLENNLERAKIPYMPKGILELAESFGALSLLDPELAAIREFLMNMIADDAPGTLWRILDEASDMPLNKANFCGGNSAIMLQDLGIWKPSPYRNISDLLEQVLIPQEYVFPPSPAKNDDLGKALLALGYDEGTSPAHLNDPLSIAVIANNLLKEGKLEAACKMIESNKANYPKLKNFYLALLSYAGVQSLYIGKLKDSERYFIDFGNAGGNRNWSSLKINEVYLHSLNHRSLSNKDLELINNVRSNIGKIKKDSNDIGDTLNEAKSFLFLGIIDRLESHYRESIYNLRKAKELFIREGDIRRVGVASANIAFTYRLMGNYEDAISNYDIAIKNFEDSKDLYRVACAKARRGSARRGTKDYEKAIEDYIESIAIFNVLDTFSNAVVLKELGTTYLRLGRWNDAVENFNKAITYFNNFGNINSNELNSRKGQTCYSLGLAYLMQAKWKASLKHFEEALLIFEKRNDTYNISLALSSLGIARRMMNDDEYALKYLHRALNIIKREIKDRNRECMLITQISEIHLKMHAYNEALKEYYNALKIAESLNDDRLIGNIVGQIGIAFRLMNNLTKAESNFKHSLQIFMGLGDKAKVSWMLEELAQVYIKQGFYDRAIQEYNSALNYLGTSDRALVNENLINLSEGYVLEAIHKGEIKKYKAALNEIEKLGALGLKCKILRNLGEAYHRNGKYEEAIGLLNKSLEIARVIDDKTQEGKILSYLGLTYADFAQSSEGVDAIAFNASSLLNLKDSLKIFRNIGDKFLEGWALENQAEVYLKQKLWNRAIENYEKAADLELEDNSGFIHLGLATCYKNLPNENSYREECRLAHRLLSIEGMNEYTLACLEAICGKLEKSIDLLEIALNKGQANIEHLSRDPYLRDVQHNLNYKKLQSKAYGNMQMMPFM